MKLIILTIIVLMVHSSAYAWDKSPVNRMSFILFKCLKKEQKCYNDKQLECEKKFHKCTINGNASVGVYRVKDPREKGK